MCGMCVAVLSRAGFLSLLLEGGCLRWPFECDRSFWVLSWLPTSRFRDLAASALARHPCAGRTSVKRTERSEGGPDEVSESSHPATLRSVVALARRNSVVRHPRVGGDPAPRRVVSRYRLIEILSPGCRLRSGRFRPPAGGRVDFLWLRTWWRTGRLRSGRFDGLPAAESLFFCWPKRKVTQRKWP